jgi:translation initiation factor eIF-2B subunit alpha
MMTEAKLDQLSVVFRNIEAEIGATAMVRMALKIIVEAAKNFEAKSVDDFLEQFREMVCMIKQTKPRIALMIYYICELWDRLMEFEGGLKSVEEIIGILENNVDLLIKETEVDGRKLVESGVSCIDDSDTILVHSHSKVVLKTINEAWQAGKQFRVVVAEQNEEKTMDIITFLQENKVPFTVVPEYMLSHVEKEVTKLFLGCITFTDDYEFVTDAGTSSVVSEFHHADIPVYMFVSTKKFSLWKGTIKHHTHKMVQKKVHTSAKEILTYERIKFSHDRVPMRLVDKVVTEDGVGSPEKVKNLYDQRFEEYKQWRERHMTDQEIENSEMDELS